MDSTYVKSNYCRAYKNKSLLIVGFSFAPNMEAWTEITIGTIPNIEPITYETKNVTLVDGNGNTKYGILTLDIDGVIKFHPLNNTFNGAGFICRTAFKVPIRN